VNAKALSVYMGHASIEMDYDRYGHLMPGNEAEAARQLDSHLIAAGEEAVRGADSRAPLVRHSSAALSS
jgi:integrase